MAALFAAAALVTLDQASKAVAGRLLAGGSVLVGPGLGFRQVSNRRSGLVAMPLLWAVVVWVAAIGVAAAAMAGASPALGTVGAIGLGLAVGGATSNLADRAFKGAVLDFIAVGPWPTFNLADAAMVIGTALLVGALL
jgi:signal peptidase II